MHKYLLIAFVFASCNCCAQKIKFPKSDSITRCDLVLMGGAKFGETEIRLETFPDSVLIIKGDTAKAIRMLIGYLLKTNEQLNMTQAIYAIPSSFVFKSPEDKAKYLTLQKEYQKLLNKQP